MLSSHALSRSAVLFLLTCSAGTATAEPIWRSKAPIPTTRQFLAVASVAGTIYAIGGSHSGVGNVATVEAYDTATDTWVSKASMLTARSRIAAVAIGETIFVVGEVPAVEAYDTTTDVWTTKTSMPVGLEGAGAVAIGGTIYVVGGWSNTGTCYAGATYRTLQAYDTATDTWTTKASMSTDRSFLMTTVVGATIYAIGGQRILACDGSWAYVQTVEAYDTRTDSWTVMPSLLPARDSGSAVSFGRRVYVLGGDYYCSSCGMNLGTLASVNELEDGASNWTWKSDLPIQRSRMAAVLVGSTIYVIGGWDGSGEVSTVLGGAIAADLRTDLVQSPTPVGVGSFVTITANVRNTGALDASQVLPDLQVSSGTPFLTLVNGPSPSSAQMIAAGATQLFTWTYSVSGLGYVEVTESTTGRDSGGTMLFWTSSLPLSVVGGARIEVSNSLDQASVTVGDWVTIRLTASNSGGLTAFNLTPSFCTNDGASLATLIGTVTPASISALSPGAMGSFTWTYSTCGEGIFSFTVTITATDLVLGTTIFASSSGSIAILNNTAPGSRTLATADIVLHKLTLGELRVAPNALDLSKSGAAIHFYMRGSPSGSVEIRIYDEVGVFVGTLGTTLDSSGYGDIPFNGALGSRRLGSGLYRAIATGGGVDYRKAFMVVARKGG